MSVLGEEERLVDDLRKQFGLVDPPGPLDEGPVDLELGTVGVEVDLLMGVPAEVVRWNVAGDDDHRDAVEGGIGDAGGGVRETGTEVAEDHRRPAGDAGVAVGGVGGDLFVAHVDEVDRAVGHRREDGDVGVPTQPEDMADAAPFEVGDELFGDGRMGRIHGRPPPPYWWSTGSMRRIGGIVWRSSLAWARMPATREAMNTALPRALGNPISPRIAAIAPSMFIGAGRPSAAVKLASIATAAAMWWPATPTSSATSRSRSSRGSRRLC